MSETPGSRRVLTEIRVGENQSAGLMIGSRSIHQFWHLFSPHFRNVLLAPQRRPGSDRVAWTWRESADSPPVAVQELADVRRRLADANRSLTGGAAGQGLADDSPEESANSLDAQVKAGVGEMVAQLMAKPDHALAGFVGRTGTGLMLHSWGSTVPAEPYYPDTHQVEVSGTVFLGLETVADIPVVIENSQGANLAQGKSDRDGVFRFPNIAPGTYRVRVTGRTDFPVGGLAVTVGRDPLPGLELRGGAIAAVDVGQATSAEKVRAAEVIPPAPRSQRRAIAWIAGLVVLAAGVGVWRFTAGPVPVAQDGNKPSGWQSARDGVAGGAGSPSASDSRPIGADSGFSNLTPASAAPKAHGLAPAGSSKLPVVTNPAHGTAAEQNASDRPASLSGDSPSVDPITSPDKSPTPTSGLPTDSLPAGSALSKTGQDGRASPATPVTTTGAPMKVEPDLQTQPDESADASVKKSSAKPAAKKSVKTLRPPAGGNPSALNSAPNKAAAADEAPSSPIADSLAAASASGKNPGKTGPAKKPAGASSGKTSTEAAAADSAGSPDSMAPAATADISPDRPAAKPASRVPQKGGAAGANSSAASTTPTNAAVPAAEDGPVARESSAAKNVPQSSPAANRKANPTANPVPAKDSASPADPAVSDAAPSVPEPGSPEKVRAKASVPGQGNAAPGATAASAPMSTPDDKPVAGPESAPSTVNAERDTRTKSARRVREPAAAGQTTGTDEPADLPETTQLPADNPTGHPLVGPAKPATGDEALAQVGCVKVSPWRSQLVQDLILPTVPLPVDQDDALAALRAKSIEERKARMLQTFRRPVTSRGFALEFPPGEPGPGNFPRWRTADGAEPAGATVQGNRAEVVWSSAVEVNRGDYVLSYPDGREIARLSMDKDGTAILKTVEEVHSWLWLRVERAPADGAALETAEANARLDWRRLPAAPLPATARHGYNWSRGHGYRLDLPLDPAGRMNGSFALVDRVTDWALVCDISIR